MVKKTEILYDLLNSKKTFFSKKETIKIIKTPDDSKDDTFQIENKVFEDRYLSLIKVIADIVYIIDKKGNRVKQIVDEQYGINNFNISKVDNISTHLTKENKCTFFAKVKETINQKREFSFAFKLMITNQSHEFEAILTHYDNYHCIIYAADVSDESKNNLPQDSYIKNKLRQLIKEKDNLEQSNKKLLSRNRDLVDSISYAEKIQRAIFPETKSFQQIFKNSFILFDPKDLVSGDMYWFEQYEDTTVLAVVDCTGHGVPGAFIAILAYSLMNKILSETNVKFKQPSELLSEIHFELTKILNTGKTETEVKDGMDISLCLINQTHNLLYFSGAFQNLYRVSDGTLQIIKGDKISVGGGNYGKKEIFRFNTQTINYDEEDSFYLTTDGYLDQFGGERDKKFLNRRFRGMIEENHEKHMSEQIEIFKNQFDTWKGDNEQVDDILVVGFKCCF